MKKFLNIAILVLLGGFLAVSCQEEEHSATINPEALTASSDLTDRLSQVTAIGNVSPDDNVLDSTNCFRVKLPVQVTANGQELSVENAQGYTAVNAIFTASNTDEDHIEFTFPITVVYPNQEELMVGNQQQFELLQGNCPSLGSDCIHLQYPISVQAYNTDFQQQFTYTFTGDDELHQFLQGLDPADTYMVNYPIGIVTGGPAVTVHSNAELLDAIVDGLASCGVTPNPCPNPDILTNGLIMYLPFANEVADLTGLGNPVSVTGDYGFVTDRSGHPNGAFSFGTGIENTVALTASAGNNLLQSDGFTISFWFNRQNADVTEFEQLYNTQEMEIALGNQIDAQIRSPFVQATGMIDPIYDTGWIGDNLLGSVNQWHHLAITYNGEVLYMYRDGVLQSGSSTVQFDTATMGGGVFGTNFKGYLDDVRMYNRALNNNEINILYQLDGDVNTCLN